MLINPAEVDLDRGKKFENFRAAGSVYLPYRKVSCKRTGRPVASPFFTPPRIPFRFISPPPARAAVPLLAQGVRRYKQIVVRDGDGDGVVEGGGTAEEYSEVVEAADIVQP